MADLRALLPALCLACSAARADQPLWEAGIGLAALQLPHYRGSDQSRAWLLPLPYFVYRGDIIKADREGARARLVDAERFVLDFSLAASAPTDSRDNQARRGMPDLAPTLEFGPNMSLLLGRGPQWKVELRAPLRGAVTLQSKPELIGWIATPNLNLDLKLGGWNFGVFGGPVLASRGHNGTFYDVAPAYATPTRPIYRAAGGAAGWQLTSGVSRRFGDLWVGAFVKADTLAGAGFVDSPLVRQRQTVAFGVALSWIFAASDRRVPGED